MVLSDVDIKEALNDINGLKVFPLSKGSIQPASIDLHLGNEFTLVAKSKEPVDIFDSDDCNTFRAKSFTIHPKSFILATTKEEVYIPPSMTAFIEGRSSIGRKGLFIHNAGYVDPGFQGQITLELFNCSNRPIIIHEGMSICQMVVSYLDTPCAKPYSGRYQFQRGTTPSRLFLDMEK